jgi:ABC-type bacteriocin/lantibiotic exporters, contain an N-terminal double-glycine peptidase domain
MKAFPFTKQRDAMDCGPACLCMVSAYYGKKYTLEHLRDNCFIGQLILGLFRSILVWGMRKVLSLNY